MRSIPHTLLVSLIILPAFLLMAPAIRAQQNPEIQSLQDSIRSYDKDLSALQQSLEGATIDWERLRYSGVRSWIISNPSLRDSLFYALMAVDSSIQSEAGAEALVLATPSDDIIEVRFGNAVFKGMTLQNAIERSKNRTLYEDIAASYRYSRDIELRDPAYALETEYEPQLLLTEDLLDYYSPLRPGAHDKPYAFRSDIALSGFIFKQGPLWGGEFKIGNEEINFPYWTSGKMAFMATYKEMKLGFELPFKGGRSPSEVFPPFILRPRLLNGTSGIVGEFDFGPFGGKFAFSRLTENNLDGLTDPASFYYITHYALAWFSFGVGLTPHDFVRVKVGGATHRVNQASLGMTPDGATEVVPIETNDILSPWVRFEYLNETIAERFRISVQFYDVTLVNTAYLEFVRDLVGIEIIYVWPLAADKPEWQNPEFLMISPHLFLNF